MKWEWGKCGGYGIGDVYVDCVEVGLVKMEFYGVIWIYYYSYGVIIV